MICLIQYAIEHAPNPGQVEQGWCVQLNMSGWGGMMRDQQLHTYSGTQPSEGCYPPGLYEDNVTLNLLE